MKLPFLLPVMLSIWPLFEVEIHEPTLDATEVRDVLLAIFDPPGDHGVYAVLADENTNRLLAIGTQNGLEKIRALLSRPPCDPPSTEPIHVIYLENAACNEVAEVLHALIADSDLFSRVRITPDEPTNSLVIEAKDADFASLDTIVAKLDEPVSKVSLSISAFELTRGDDGATISQSIGNRKLVVSENEPIDEHLARLRLRISVRRNGKRLRLKFDELLTGQTDCSITGCRKRSLVFELCDGCRAGLSYKLDGHPEFSEFLEVLEPRPVLPDGEKHRILLLIKAQLAPERPWHR